MLTKILQKHNLQNMINIILKIQQRLTPLLIQKKKQNKTKQKETAPRNTYISIKCNCSTTVNETSQRKPLHKLKTYFIRYNNNMKNVNIIFKIQPALYPNKHIKENTKID